ncbi:hypothetical protein [uncultured Leifsonia sp.]|uniref:hypothetical protein n=1 Tax=uncultured Leifsonia sp. TaxID=340359 RepID=UPI0028D58D90|nr:hypothetical protein [uncultured Leifsonia sp.]
MKSQVSASARSEAGRNDWFLSAVYVAVQSHVSRLQVAMDVAVRTEPVDGHSLFGELFERAALEGENRDELVRAFAEFAEGVQELAKAAESGENLEFSLSLPDGETSEAFNHLLLAAARQAIRPSRAAEACKGALLLMAASLETLVADLASALIRDRPAVVDLGSKQMTLGQMEELGSIEAVRAYAAAKAVDGLMRGGIDQWADWFHLFAVEWKEIPENWWAFREIDARRNLVAHAGSIVNEFYLKIARDNDAESVPEAGQELSVDESYLRKAHAELAAFGVLVGASVSMRHRPDALGSIYSWGAREARALLDDEVYDGARMIAARLLSVARGRLARRTEIDIRVTDWLARKALGGVEAIRSEVERYDFAGLDLTMRHFRSLLLDDDDVAIEQIQTLIARNDLRRTRVRLSNEYSELRSRRGTDWLDVE